MKRIKLLTVLLLGLQGFSQEEYLNSIYMEALGTGGLISVNYERQFSANTPLSFRIGLGYVPELFEPASLTLPYGLNYNLRISQKWRLETGLGSTILVNSWLEQCRILTDCPVEEEGLRHVYFASLGMKKFFGPQQKYMWKLNTSLPVARVFDGRFKFEPSIPWLGISIGTRF